MRTREAPDAAGPRQAVPGRTGPGRPGKELDCTSIALHPLQKALPNVPVRADHNVLCTTMDCDETFTMTTPRVLPYTFQHAAAGQRLCLSRSLYSQGLERLLHVVGTGCLLEERVSGL